MKYIIDLHTHTISSGHAYSTLEENIEGAIKKNIKILGISDHAPKMPGAPHLFHFKNMKIIPNKIKGIQILTGVEVNILDYNGNIDMKNDDLISLDYAIASLHPPCIIPSTIEDNTKGLIKIIENPLINIIGHPDDGRYPLDYEQIVIAAKKNNTLLELNNSSLNPLGYRMNSKENSKKLLNLCIKHNASIILGSDAHISYSIGDFSLCEKLINEVNFPEELIVNTSKNKLMKYLKK